MDERTGMSAQRAWVMMSEMVLDNERRRKVSDDLGLSFARVRALRRIAARPMPMGELAALLGIDPPYMTLMVDDLQERGLVVRRDHPTDRRVKLVVATEEGANAAKRAQQILDQPPPALGALCTEDLDALERILTKVREARE